MGLFAAFVGEWEGAGDGKERQKCEFILYFSLSLQRKEVNFSKGASIYDVCKII